MSKDTSNSRVIRNYKFRIYPNKNDFFKEVHSQVAQEVLFRVERAFD